jgi:hypothetical protein
MSIYCNQFEFNKVSGSIRKAEFDENNKPKKQKYELSNPVNKYHINKPSDNTYEQSQFTDACIKINGNEFHMTKHQLCQMSGYFRNYFSSDPTNNVFELSESPEHFKDLLNTFIPHKRKKIKFDDCWWHVFKLANKYDFREIYTECKNVIKINKCHVLSVDQIEYVIHSGDDDFAQFLCKRLVGSDSEIDFEMIKNDRMRLYIINYLDIKRRDYKQIIIKIIDIIDKTYIDSNTRNELRKMLKSEAIDISL